MDFSDKYVDQLSLEEIASIHLDLSYSPTVTRKAVLRSTLSFIYENVQHALHNDRSKQLMPYLSLCSILEQLGVCYNRTDKPQPKFTNCIKRCLFYFGEISKDDEIINTIYALRNGLLHNVSLTSISNDRKDRKSVV